LNNVTKSIGFLIFSLSVFLFYRYALFGYREGEIKVTGLAPDGYGIKVVTLYRSKDKSCRESDWNTGSWKDGVTSESTAVRVEEGHYEAALYRHIKKRFCDWDMIYTRVDLLSPRYTADIKVKEPIYSVLLRESEYKSDKKIVVKEGKISETFVCALEDRVSEDKGSVKRTMFCVNKDKGYDNELTLDSTFDSLSKVLIDFDLKEEIYCFVGRRSCPAYAKMGQVEEVMTAFKIEAGILKPEPIKKHTYSIDTSNMKSLYAAISLDDADYNISKAKEILSKHGELVTSSGYRLFQSSIAWSFAYGRIDFETIKMLASYGYDISQYKNEYFSKDEVMHYLKSLDIEEASFYQGYDYDTLPATIQKELYTQGITAQKGYYIQKPREGSLLSDIGSVYREKSVEIIAWMLSQGYKASQRELAYALYHTLYHDDLKDPSAIIQAYINMGADLHDPEAGFALMETMRLRFDDIKTLKTLIDVGVDINAQDKEYGTTVLYSLNYKLGDKYRRGCSYKAYKDVIKEYIKLGADINHKSKEGTTLFQSLERECDKKALKELGAVAIERKKE